MKISTRGRYAVRALLDLAMQQSQSLISTKDIESRQGISERYLEQIFGYLREAGLLISHRGPKGGFRLVREPHLISVAEILMAAEKPFAVAPCGSADEGCNRAETACVTHALWQQADQILLGYFGNITLKDLCDQAVARQNAKSITNTNQSNES